MRLRVYEGGVVDAKAYKQARTAEILPLPPCPCSPKLHIVHLYTQEAGIRPYIPWACFMEGGALCNCFLQWLQHRLPR